MSYLVIARKWRPQSWDDVVAQEHVTSTLKNAIQHDRLAHAYLFCGPRGVGKTSAARILSKALNCDDRAETNPCNQCSSCVEISESRSVDVFEIDGASNRGIDEVRNLRENIHYAPARGKYKIYIIDEVHMLTPPAFNALLKTLEEPPSHVLFIFATTEPHKVPATILSRCQRFDFRRISTKDISLSLEAICQKENISIEAEALHLIARKADGSMRDSQSLLDQIVSYTEGSIKAEDVIRGLGLIEREIFFKVTDAIRDGNASQALTLVDEVVTSGYDIEEFLLGLAEHLRNLLVARALQSGDLVEATDDQKKRYVALAETFQEEDVLRLIRIVLDTKSSLKRSLNPRLPLELSLVKMVKLNKTVQINDLLSRLEKMPAGGNAGTSRAVNTPTQQKEGGASNPGPPPVAEAPPAPASADPGPQDNVPMPPEPPPSRSPSNDSATGAAASSDEKKNNLSLEVVKSHWDEIIQKIKHKKITVGSFLQEGVLAAVEGKTIEIGFGKSNGFHIDAINRCREMVLEVMREVLGQDVLFKCVKMDIPQRAVPDTKEAKEEQLKSIMDQEPVIQKIVNDFDAEIIE